MGSNYQVSRNRRIESKELMQNPIMIAPVETNIRPKKIIKTKLTTISTSTTYNYLYFRLILIQIFP
jgi:hypothetical protein